MSKPTAPWTPARVIAEAPLVKVRDGKRTVESRIYGIDLEWPRVRVGAASYETSFETIAYCLNTDQAIEV
jgi:hypothetical protein